MKKVIDVSIGRIKFTLEEDAHAKLNDYLKRFKATITDPTEVDEVMQDIEFRVAEIFQKEQSFPNQVVNLKLVETVIEHLGEIEDSATNENTSKENNAENNTKDGYTQGSRKLYKCVEDRKISGVCGGLGIYLGIDSTIIRIAFVLLFVFGGVGVIAYIILMIAVTKAETVAQKLELRGYATTAENIKRYTATHK